MCDLILHCKNLFKFFRLRNPHSSINQQLFFSYINSKNTLREHIQSIISNEPPQNRSFQFIALLLSLGWSRRTSLLGGKEHYPRGSADTMQMLPVWLGKENHAPWKLSRAAKKWLGGPHLARRPKCWHTWSSVIRIMWKHKAECFVLFFSLIHQIKKKEDRVKTPFICPHYSLGIGEN